MTVWNDWLDQYAEAMRLRNLSPVTVDLRQTWIRQFALFCRACGDVPPVGVTLLHLVQFDTHLQTKNKPTSRLMALQSVRVFFRWALRTQRLLVDPTELLALPRESTIGQLCLTCAEVEALLQPPPDETPEQRRNRTLLETLYGTAIRLGECRALDLDDLNLRNGVLRVRRGKGRHERFVPVGPHLASLLQAYLEQVRPGMVWSPFQTALFVSNSGDRLAGVTIQKLARAAGDRIGLAHVGPHTLRRACATHMLAAGAALEAIQQLLGHASVAATERYVQLTWAQVKAEHARTHPRAGRLPPTQP